MVFKIAALFLVAAATKVERTANNTQWIYDKGPNKGYLCAIMQKDGANFDVFVPSAVLGSSQTAGGNATAMAPVPWQHFGTQNAALATISKYCPVN